MQEHDFVELLREVLAGAPDASQRFLDLYGPELLRSVRRRLPRQLRPQFDSLDFVQDVWGSFFAAPERRNFADSEQLLAYLTTVARNKVTDSVRQRMSGQKRNVNREQRLTPNADDSTCAPYNQLTDHNPTPSQNLMEEEEWHKLLQSQPPVYRKVLDMLRHGKSVKQVSQELNISERTVTRLISRVMSRLTIARGEC